MNKYELVAHLANLTFIFDHHEKLGTTKNKALIEDFQAYHNELITMVEKENEARKRQLESRRSETRIDLPRGERGDGQPDREPRGDPNGGE